MEFKKLWRVFIFLFLIVFISFNWNQVSWIFNYRAVSGFLEETFSGSDKEIQITILDGNFEEVDNYAYQPKEGSVAIPKIGITAPLVFVNNSDQRGLEEALDFGVVHFPDSVFPGEPGQTIILGHSSPSGWPKIKYDWVFTDLNELIEGDEIHVFVDGKRYEYVVDYKVFLEKGEELLQESLTNNKNMLILISCWPPGKDLRRIAVVANEI